MVSLLLHETEAHTTQHYLPVMFNDVTVWPENFKGLVEPLKFDPRNVSS